MRRLDELREKINQIDNQILILLGKRMKVVKKIGKYKKKNNLPILDRIRFKRVLVDRIKKGCRFGLQPNLIKKIFETIHEEALQIENKL